MRLFFLSLSLICLAAASSSAQQYGWQKLKTDPYPGKQDDICFIDENTGWYVNGAGKIYHTGDGGATWTLQLEQKGTFFRCIAFIDSLRGFAGTVGTDYFPNVTDTIPLYQTLDGGKNWQPVSYEGPYVKGLCAIDVVKEQFVNHGEIGYRYHVFCVGRVGAPANLLVSHDDGRTFQSSSLEAYSSMLFDIKMFDKKEGVACGASDAAVENSHARMLHTQDGGKTWQTTYESTRPYELTWKCAFPTRLVGYATIQSYNPDTSVVQQYFLKTTDGGRSWTEMKLCSDYRSRSFGVGFIDENIGFIGTRNTGYQTLDGGKNWQKTNLGAACNKIRIQKSAAGTTYGYAIGVDVLKLVGP